MRANYWEAKAYYNMGDYKTSVDLADAQVKIFMAKYPDLDTKAAKEEIILSLSDDDENMSTIKEIKSVEVPNEISYIFLKYRLMQARINKAIGLNGLAHDIVNSILVYIKQFSQETPSKFWLIAFKASQVQMTQLCNAKEFDSALLMLKNIGQKVIDQVSEHYLPTEKKDEGKVLQDNYYSFGYRIVQAQFHIYF